MTTPPDDWLPEHIAGLSQTIREMWPNAGEEAVDNLSAGLMHLVRRRRLAPNQLFPALVDAADEGWGERIISVSAVAAALGRRRARAEGVPPPSDRKQIEPRVSGKPWAPSLWTAAFVAAGGPERLGRVRSDLLVTLRPWLDLVNRLGLRPVHGVDGPEKDEPKLAEADRQAADVWRKHGGLSEAKAIRVLGGW